jgi:hypothetical protein
VDVDLDWQDADHPWWVKLCRARTHIDELCQAVAEFERAEPWRVETEPGRRSDELAYRFRIDRPIPADLSGVVGDVVHSLRSALDAVVTELVRRHLGQVTPRQQRETAFVSAVDETKFRQDFERRLSGLCGDRGLKAVMSVQPFAFASEEKALGVEVERDPEADLAMDVPHRLNVLWNIDKHRRLLDLGWYVDELVYWDSAGKGCGWRTALPRQGPLSDGDPLGHFRTGEGVEVGSVEPHLEFWLGLTDDPCPYPDDVRKLLAGWHDSLAGWVVPRMFITAETDGPPPIMISFR